MNFINLRSVFNRKVRAKNPLLFIYKPVSSYLKKTMADKKYPIEYTDEEIIEKINSQSKYLMKKDLTPAAAAKYSGRITIGLTELQNRKQTELNIGI